MEYVGVRFRIRSDGYFNRSDDNYTCMKKNKKIIIADAWMAFDPITNSVLFDGGVPMLFIQRIKPKVFMTATCQALVKRIKISTI